ncbi:hypothetical protein EOD39_0895 [Acipenser ruthenus]|uniref:Uncharacterized protein n=1 Tax=Acipenser ruthenus TaxID=7906 RepID=A0A444UKV0_ACIRT|nr:hypothetical protein EOD39_0895 [Acipenser ruthenus]
MHSFLHVRLGSLPLLTSSGMFCAWFLLSYQKNAQVTQISTDELVFLEQPQDNGGDSPCVLHLQCTSQGGCEIAFLQVVSEARIIEVYSDTEYCGTCPGEKVSSLQINGVNESISLYKKRVHLECPVTSCEVKNQQDNLGGFLGLLMGNREFAALGKENAGSRPTPDVNAQTAEDFELAGDSLDHNSASSLEAEVTAGGVLTTENLQHPFGVDNGPPPANQITDMVSSYLRNQTKQKQNTISVDMLPFLQSVCGQVKQLRIEDGAQKSEAVQRSKPSPELEKEHVCCSSLEKVLEKQMEMMEKRLMHCIDQRLNALEDSLERKVQSALDIVRRADGPNTVKQDCGCHGALVNGNA